MSITRKETRHGRCPFCESQTTKNDRINTDHVAIWCAKCGATMEIPQGKMSYSDALDMLYDRWYSRPIEKKLQARIAELEAENLKVKTENAFNKDAFQCFIDLIYEFEEDDKYMCLDIEHRDTRIAELEAENANLTKALEKAAKRLTKEQVCPKCDNNCQQC